MYGCLVNVLLNTHAVHTFTYLLPETEQFDTVPCVSSCIHIDCISTVYKTHMMYTVYGNTSAGGKLWQFSRFFIQSQMSHGLIDQQYKSTTMLH